MNLDRLHRLQVVQRRQPPVGDQHHPPDRIARERLPERGRERMGFGRMAGKHFMVNRPSFGGLYDAEHHLARDIAFLGQSELTQLAGGLRPTFGADRRQVVEDDCFLARVLYRVLPREFGTDARHPAGAARTQVDSVMYMARSLLGMGPRIDRALEQLAQRFMSHLWSNAHACRCLASVGGSPTGGLDGIRRDSWEMPHPFGDRACGIRWEQ